jgi:hypothetical protein
MQKCPGSNVLRGAKITEKTCPECGRQIEIFSIFPVTVCECGFTAYNETQSCIKWCAYARDCVGEDMYEKLMGIK